MLAPVLVKASEPMSEMASATVSATVSVLVSVRVSEPEWASALHNRRRGIPCPVRTPAGTACHQPAKGNLLDASSIDLVQSKSRRAPSRAAGLVRIIVMVYMVVAYIVMTCGSRAHYSYGPYGYGLYSYDLRVSCAL